MNSRMRQIIKYFLIILIPQVVFGLLIASVLQGQSGNSAERIPRAALAAETALDPALALANEKPTLIYFYPFDLCQTRYCRQPIMIQSELHARFQDQVDFVRINLRDQRAHELEYPIETWNLYPVAKFVRIMQVAKEAFYTTDGLAIAGALLVSTDGVVVWSDGEFFSWDNLEHVLVEELSK